MRYLNDGKANYDNKASSVDVGLSCIILYEHIGCTGKQLKLSIEDGENCHHDLSICNFNDMTSSVSFCDAEFQSKEVKCEHEGYGGSCCVDTCETRGRPYFWCNLQNQDWDYCSPRPGINFLGIECGPDCNVSVTKFPQSVILYEDLNYNGKQHQITEEDEDKTRCINFPSTNYSQATIHGGFASIHLDFSCVLLYNNIGCVGNPFEVSSETKESCWKDLRKCNKGERIVSAQLCTARLPLPYNQPNGSGGSPCVTQCHHRGKNYFWCHLGNGSLDFCSPRPGSDYYGNDCGDNCTTNELQLHHFETTGNAQRAILFVQEKFKGKNKTIDSVNNTSCFTMDYDETLQMNFNNAIDSIKLSTGTCLQLYESPNCFGEFKVLSDWDNVKCQEQLEKCNLNGRISSISFSSPVLIHKNSNINGITSRRTKYFPCSLDNDSTALCSKKPGDDYFENDCARNCSYNESIPQQERGGIATMFSQKSFEGHQITINEPKCFNLEYDFKGRTNLFKAVMSISMDNSACLILYNRIGCTGETLVLSQNKTETVMRSHPATRLCFRDLEKCYWEASVSSVRFCGSNFTSQYRPAYGFSGGYCRTFCRVGDGNYFRCYQGNGTWDFCHPRSLNYMGESWGIESDYSDDSVMHLILYTHKNFEGNQSVIKMFGRTRCVNTMTWDHNLNSTFHKPMGSIDIKWHCLSLHEQIGCMGDSLEIFPDDTENYHQDLESHGWSNRVSSISLCDAHFPPKFGQPRGSRGEECNTICEPRGEPYFWCQVGSLPHEVDFCLPRPHQDYFGNYCEGNCSDTDPWEKLPWGPSSSGRTLNKICVLIITTLLQIIRFACLNAENI